VATLREAVAVTRTELRPASLPTRHRQLMPQDDDLQLVGFEPAETAVHGAGEWDPQRSIVA
jgi:hypothetical protein